MQVRNHQVLILAVVVLALAWAIRSLGLQEKNAPEAAPRAATPDELARAPTGLAAPPVVARGSDRERASFGGDERLTLLVRFYDGAGAAVTLGSGDAAGLQGRFLGPWTDEPADDAKTVRVRIAASVLTDSAVAVFWRIHGYFDGSISITELSPVATKDPNIVEIKVHLRRARPGGIRVRIVDRETGSSLAGGTLSCFRGRAEAVIAVADAEGVIDAQVDEGMDRCFVLVPGYWPLRVSMPASDEAIDAGVVALHRAPEPASLVVQALGASSTARAWVKRVGSLASPQEDYPLDLLAGRAELNNRRGGTESQQAAWSTDLGRRRENLLPGLYDVVVRDPERGVGAERVQVTGATIASIPLERGGSLTMDGLSSDWELIAEAVGDRSGREHIARGGRIDNLPPGSYRVSIRPVVRRTSEKTLVAKLAEVRREETTHLGNLSPTGGVRVSGQMVVAGQPLRDVEISLAPGSRVATTNADGRFVFEQVQPGDYVMSLRGYRFSSGEMARIRIAESTKSEEEAWEN